MDDLGGGVWPAGLMPTPLSCPPEEGVPGSWMLPATLGVLFGRGGVFPLLIEPEFGLCGMFLESCTTFTVGRILGGTIMSNEFRPGTFFAKMSESLTALARMSNFRLPRFVFEFKSRPSPVERSVLPAPVIDAPLPFCF